MTTEQLEINFSGGPGSLTIARIYKNVRYSKRHGQKVKYVTYDVWLQYSDKTTDLSFVVTKDELDSMMQWIEKQINTIG